MDELAASQRFLVSRAQILELGIGEKTIEHELRVGRWLWIHAGVYQVDRRPLSWRAKVQAAVLAGGAEAVASHRAALLLWRLEGLPSAPIEITMPFGNLAWPCGVIVHRTRREYERADVDGIAVTTVERTLLDCATFLPRVVLAKALDSAIRKNLTSVDRVAQLLVTKGGRGVRGTRALRHVVRDRVTDTATGSASEFELMSLMKAALIPLPEVQHPIVTRNGRRIPDFYWPDLGKAVEVDGVDAHASADRLDEDLIRQNDLLDLGIELRRFSARRIRRDPAGVVDEIRRFLDD